MKYGYDNNNNARTYQKGKDANKATKTIPVS